MKKVLLTGSSGFVGRNILPVLQEKYEVVAPNRSQLDLRDTNAVYDFVKKGKFDVVFNSANPNPVKNSQSDDQANMMQDSLKIFMNFYRTSDLCEKIIYLGSGAEFDKTRDLKLVKEEQINERIPNDIYGFSKYMMNQLAITSKNIFNMRLFACYGPTDHESKFITHAINCCKNNLPVTIRQDCYFDYMHVNDFAELACWFIDNTPQLYDYNISTAKRIRLSEIAEIICKKMGNNNPVEILNDGFNKEYSADNNRLINEMGGYDFISIDKGIDMQIESQR